MVRMGPGTQFLPDVINVAVGGTVCWTNDDFLTHNATSVPPGAFATLRLMRTARTVARIRRTLRPGGNTIRLRVATRLPRGRYLARLTVEGRRYTASVRL